MRHFIVLTKIDNKENHVIHALHEWIGDNTDPRGGNVEMYLYVRPCAMVQTKLSPA